MYLLHLLCILGLGIGLGVGISVLVIIVYLMVQVMAGLLSNKVSVYSMY